MCKKVSTYQDRLNSFIEEYIQYVETGDLASFCEYVVRSTNRLRWCGLIPGNQKYSPIVQLSEQDRTWIRKVRYFNKELIQKRKRNKEDREQYNIEQLFRQLKDSLYD